MTQKNSVLSFLILATLIFISPRSVLAQTALKLKSQEALSTSLINKTFTADLKDGFHFNDKAPNSLNVDGSDLMPLKFEARHLEFILPIRYKQAAAALYVCDNAITFCETHHILLKGEKAASASKVNSKAGTVNAQGFIQDDFKKALSLAQKKKQLVLMDFSARWCPGCVRYEKEIFSTAEFKKLTKHFVKLKIDVDQFQNFPLSEQFKIIGIPTIVVVNADLFEVDRLVDFQTLDRLKPFFAALNNSRVPLNDLLAQGSTDPKIRLQLGLRLFEAGRFAQSLPFLKEAGLQLGTTPPQLLAAQVSAAQEAFQKDPTKKESYAQELRQALKLENNSSRSLSWSGELLRSIDNKSPEAKSVSDAGQKLADHLLTDPEALKEATKTDQLGEFLGFEKLMIAQYKADLIEASGASEELVLKSWKEAAQVGTDYKIPFTRTGPSFRHLAVLSQAKMWPEAEALAKNILKADPKNSEAHRRLLKYLLEQKKYAEAQIVAEKLIQVADGRVQFWVAESLAKAYIGADKKDSAKRLITVYLARPEIQDQKMASSKKGLEDLLQLLQ